MRYPGSRKMRYFAAIASSAAIGVCTWHTPRAAAESGQPNPGVVAESSEASPIYGVRIPPGYRDWGLISVTHEGGDFNQLRAQLGNETAIRAYRDGTRPFPDGSIIVALHWNRVPSDDDNKVFGREQAFVAGSAVNMQVMVKDSIKYASTGGWGFGDFRDGKPSDRAVHEKCFACHVPAKENDYVYTHYAP